ncbi:hypothetical protein DSO57_1005281 [Entomophthora muscae]|uniref:Uncharacterized protein n=1 Tax=Entomophthora muscae TaxID=34485 RepID=A0ACC2TIX6_9FUNG|nr:hypothetical protein DSO57_1005281 [Entomophthora muscae]
MSAHNNSQPSLRQVYQDLMAGMTDEDCKVFMQMLCSSWVRFLNQLLPVNSYQLWAQDCNTTVMGSERGTPRMLKGKRSLTLFFQRLRRP